jgi:hypothetical protein
MTRINACSTSSYAFGIEADGPPSTVKAKLIDSETAHVGDVCLLSSGGTYTTDVGSRYMLVELNSVCFRPDAEILEDTVSTKLDTELAPLNYIPVRIQGWNV